VFRPLNNLEIDPDELRRRMRDGNRVMFVDLRDLRELEHGFIEGALVMPMGQLHVRYGELPEHSDIVVYCASGDRALQATVFLWERGLTNVRSLAGGLFRWQIEGGRVIVPAQA